jgi:ABC-type antimicrobial peptide transport system permease subunit
VWLLPKLRRLLKRNRSDEDFAEEIASHIALEADQLAGSGRSPDIAAAEARRRFGNVGLARERFHESRGWPMIDSLVDDVRYATRLLRKSPIFTATAVLSLALGVGANTAVFTLVNAVLFKKLAVPNAERLVWVRGDDRFPTMSYPTIARFRNRESGFAAVAGVFSLDRAARLFRRRRRRPPAVAIISESMARHYFGTANALGKRYGTARDEGAPIEVIGVVRDAKDGSLREENVEMMYLPYRQAEGRLNQMRVIVRSVGDPTRLVLSVRKALHELAPQLPISDVAPITVQMGRTIAMERFTTLASGFFGGVALLLAAFGLYATVSHVVEARTTEIGVRMALGATAQGVVRMILRDHFTLIVGGLAAGVIAAAVAGRAVSARLFGCRPWTSRHSSSRSR